MIMYHELEPATDVMPETGTVYVYCKRCGQPANQHVTKE